MGKLLNTSYSDAQEKEMLRLRPDLKEQYDSNPEAIRPHFQTMMDEKFKGVYSTEQDFDGRPFAPDYASMIDPKTGQLESRFQLGAAEKVSPWADEQLGKLNLNTEGIDKLRGIGTGTGRTDWANLAIQRQGVEEAAARDEANTSADRNASNIWNQLAMRGGASGGERERAAAEGVLSGRNAVASVNRQGMLDRFAIDEKDQGTRMDVLKSLPGLENTALDPQFKKIQLAGQAKESDINRDVNTRQFNITNLVKDFQNKNQFDQDKYSQGMQAWAAGKTADAQTKAASGGGVSYICTAVHKEEPFEITELESLAALREASMDMRPDRAFFYFSKCEGLVPKMREMGVNFREFRPFVKTVLFYINEYGVEYAMDYYWDYLKQVLQSYDKPLYEEALKIVEPTTVVALEEK